MSPKEEIQAWLMYYWRSLFYTSVPTRKPIDQRSSNQVDLVPSGDEGEPNEDAREDNEEETADADIGPGANLLEGIVDEELARKFNDCSNGRRKPVVFLVAPVRVRRSDEDESPFEFFPFWFPLVATFNDQTSTWDVSCYERFHDIYVPRRFMTPQAGENDYVMESGNNGTFIFTTCEKYEENYAIDVNPNMSLQQYVEAVKRAFYRMTGQKMDEYNCKEPGAEAEFNLFIHIERPNDYTKKIRALYSDYLQRKNVRIPPLLCNLILPKQKDLFPVRKESDEFSETGKLHLGQMNSKYPLSSSQRKALLTWLKNESVEDIMVVNGPPGTGKTTLIQSLVANKIVQSAINGDKPFVALCCASTHKAVTNIIDCFNGEIIESAKNDTIRLLPDIKGYASYVSSKDNEYTERYLHFKPATERSFCPGPILPGKKGSSGVETEEFRNHALGIFLENFHYGDSLLCIAEKLREDVLHCSGQISLGINALLDFLYEGKETAIRDWYTTLQKDISEKKVRRPEKHKIDFEPEDDNIEEHFQELLDVTYRYRAFVYSVRYWEARWLNDAVISDEAPKDHQDKARMLLQKAMLTPCFVTTLHSSVSLFSCFNKGINGKKEGLDPLLSFADYLILDEAGQTLPEIGTAAFALAQKAIVFGDVEQLEPIHNLHPKLDVGDLIQTGIPSSKEDKIKYMSRSMLSSSGNMVAFAQSACSIKDSIQDQRGIMLVEHWRCRKEIIDYCNKLVYAESLKPMAGARSTYLYPPFSFVPIAAESTTSQSNSSRFNEKEADAIVNWIVAQEQSLRAEYDGKRLEDIIAIITPFKAQEKLLKEKLKNSQLDVKVALPTTRDDEEQEDDNGGKDDRSPMVIGTVHKLQGAQAPIVIFSSVYGNNDRQMRFVDTKPNMLNVAVSRAQDAFIVFGNASLYHKSALRYYCALWAGKNTILPSGLLKVFCNRFDSSTPFIFDSMLEYKMGSDSGNSCEKCTDGEKVIVDLLNELQMTYSQHVPLSEVYNKLKSTMTEPALNKKELDFILDTDSHYDFLVAFDSTPLVIEVDGGKHSDSLQQERDKLKDSITNKLGISMLRLSTSIRDSKKDVRNTISSFILSALSDCYSEKKRSWEITLSLHLDGFSIDEISDVRKLQKNTIKMHLAKAVINKQLDAHGLMSDDRLSEIIHSVKKVYQVGMKQSDIFQALCDTIEYYEIAIALYYLKEIND